MANSAVFKKVFLFTALFFALLVFAPVSFAEDEIPKAQSENQKYAQIYDNLSEPDFSYIFNLDPYQAQDYTTYMYAPYPLFRTGIRFVFKNTVIQPGYYLLTPREKDGKWYVLFKTNGKVQHIIPVYKKELVDPMFYKMYVPERKLTLWQSICKKSSDTVGKIFKKTQRMPAPKSYIDVNELGSDYWQIVLYYGDSKYCMIFMR